MNLKLEKMLFFTNKFLMTQKFIKSFMYFPLSSARQESNKFNRLVLDVFSWLYLFSRATLNTCTHIHILNAFQLEYLYSLRVQKSLI